MNTAFLNPRDILYISVVAIIVAMIYRINFGQGM